MNCHSTAEWASESRTFRIRMTCLLVHQKCCIILGEDFLFKKKKVCVEYLSLNNVLINAVLFF